MTASGFFRVSASDDLLCRLDGADISELRVDAELAALPDSEHSPVIPIPRHIHCQNLRKSFIVPRRIFPSGRNNVIGNELIGCCPRTFSTDSDADEVPILAVVVYPLLNLLFVGEFRCA